MVLSSSVTLSLVPVVDSALGAASSVTRGALNTAGAATDVALTAAEDVTDVALSPVESGYVNYGPDYVYAPEETMFNEADYAY